MEKSKILKRSLVHFQCAVVKCLATAFLLTLLSTSSMFAVATVHVSDGVITVNSDNAGELTSYLDGLADNSDVKTAIRSASTKVVLSGYFNENDLSRLSSINNQSATVDLRDAHFSGNVRLNYWYGVKTLFLSDHTNSYQDWSYPDGLENLYFGKSFTEIPAYISQRFRSVKFVSIPSTVKSIGTEAFNSSGGLETVVFETESQLETIGERAFQNTSLKSVEIPNSVKTIGKSAFEKCYQLEGLSFQETSQVETIGESAFQDCGKLLDGQTFVVPNSVKRIELRAFMDCKGIKNLVFDKDSKIEYIAEYAFYMNGGSGLSNVYVNCEPAREIPCHWGAFDKWNMCGQTQVGTVTTRLHYPSEFYDFYVGNYKSEINGGIMDQSYLSESDNRASNGWQRFISSGIPIGSGSLYRSYSDDVAFEVPATNVLEVFLVYDYDKEQNIAFLVRMKPGDVIPEKTGVIVHSDREATIYLKKVDNVGQRYDHESFPENKYTATGGNGVAYDNYLKQINGSLHIDNVEVAGGEKSYRNFFFNKGETAASRPGPDWNPDWQSYDWGFFRAASADYTVWNKAFLHLPAEMTEASSTYLNQNQQSDSGSASVKSFNFVVVDSWDSTEDATSIALPSEGPENVGTGAYYTLQGVKVAHPESKGIYIHNGKKIMVK